jgi:hypothetical protein
MEIGFETIGNATLVCHDRAGRPPATEVKFKAWPRKPWCEAALPLVLAVYST